MNRKCFRILVKTVLLIVFFSTAGMAQQTAGISGKTGSIQGTLVDASNGEELIGANVLVKDLSLGDAADISGDFVIVKVPAGTYTLVASMIGYARQTLADIEVKAGEVTVIDISLLPEAYEMEEVVIEAKLLLNNEAGLLKERQRAIAVSDAISADDIERSGSRNAAAAMTKVTGASTVEGKYVYIRGLGERYSGTRLNGAEVPSADPNRRSVQLDLFPAAFLENLTTTKTFTPDMPGDYTGGSVNIQTKSFPGKMNFSISTSAEMNGQSTNNANFLTYAGGETDWLAIDDGTRGIPEQLQDPNVEIPDVSYAYSDPGQAAALNDYSKAWNNVMSLTQKTAPVNRNFAMSYGNQWAVGENKLGFISSFSYQRKYTLYETGTVGRWQLTGNVDEVETLTKDYMLNDARGVDAINWGGMANFSWQLGPAHEVGFNFIYNRAGDNSSRFLEGEFPRDLTGNAVYETRALQYIERELQTYQLRGKHHFENVMNLGVEWNASIATTTQDEPDVRYFTNNYTIRERNDVLDTVYSIRPAMYPIPSRYFRGLEESNNAFSADFTLPFKQWNELGAKVRFGGFYQRKDRSFRERRFDFNQDKLKYDGDANSFFDRDNMGVLPEQSSETFFRFGNYVTDATSLANNYNGDQSITATYAMVDLPIFNDVRAIVGARYEITQMDVTSLDTSVTAGRLDDRDLLPSVSLLYSLTGRMNLRAAYGKTLARPTFRELAPYASFNFVNDYTFIGNADLQRTLVDNYDLRWEFFTRPGQIVAVSGFYKKFTNPIERVIKNINGEIQYQNVDEATVYGAEFEYRTGLDFIHSSLSRFFFGTNLTLTRSIVSISENELQVIRSVNPYASDTRTLQGQSPFLFNINLTYGNPASGTNVSVYYNLFGERLSAVSLGGTPNVFEQPRGMLDLMFAQRLFRNFQLRLAGKNLLNEEVLHVHHYKGEDYIQQAYNTGRAFSVGFSYDLN